MQQGAFKSNELISFTLWSRSLSVTIYSNVSLTDKEVSNETELPDERSHQYRQLIFFRILAFPEGWIKTLGHPCHWRLN